MAKCSYCGEEKKMSKEHIWSDNLLRLFEPDAIISFDDTRGIAYNDDPVIRDLCEGCNGKLSLADAYIKQFAMRYCLSELKIGTHIEFDKELITRWSLKTASNFERFNKAKGEGWWRVHVDAMRGMAPISQNVEVLFAAWRDSDPLSRVWPHLTLAAETAVLVESDVGIQGHSAKGFERAWAMKIGCGVILILVFSGDSGTSQYSQPLIRLHEWGWLRVGKDTEIKRYPFNHITCRKFGILSDPDHPEYLFTDPPN